MIIFSRFFGILADAWGKKKFIILELLVGLIAYIFMYMAILARQVTIIHILVFSFLMGLSWAIGSGAFIAAVTMSLTKEQTGRASGIYVSFSAIGWTVGSIVSGFMADQVGIGSIFEVAVLMTVLGVMIIWLGYSEIRVEGPHSLRVKEAWRAAWSFHVEGDRKRLMMVYLIVVLINLGASIYFLVFIIKFYIIVGTKTMYGLITGFAGVWGILAPYVISGYVDRLGKDRVLLYTLLVRVLFMYILAFSWDWTLAIIFWVIPLWGIIDLTIISMTTDYAAEGRESEAHAIRTTLGFVFSTLGNVVGGLLSSLLGIERNISQMYIILLTGVAIYSFALPISIVLVRAAREGS